MLIAIHESSSRLNAIQGEKLYAHCHTWSEALCSLLYMEIIIMFNAIQKVKYYALCYRWSEALCSFLYME